MDGQGHLSMATMENYVNDTLTDAAAYAADEHLGGCDECVEELRVLREIDIYWQQWTPAVHGAIYREAQLEAILESAALRNPAIGIRLQKWIHHWGNRVGAAVKAVWKLPGEMTRLLDEGVDQLLPLRAGLSFSYAVAPPRVLGTKPDPTQPPAIDPTKVRISGDVFVEVALDEAQGRIEVCLRGIRQEPPLVLLVTEADQQNVMAQLPEYQLETNCFICQFERVPSGNYFIVVEPWQ